MNLASYDAIKKALSPLRGLGLRKFPPVQWALGALKPHKAFMPGGVRTIFLDPADFVVSEEISRGGYEQFESSVILKLVGPADTVIDLGANIGYYTILFCDAAKNGHVYAFEPSPKTFGYLRKSILANGFKNVTLHEMAVGDRDGEAEIFINGYNKGDNRLYQSFETKGVPIRISTLDSVIPAGTKVDLIKMDIQGFEEHALRGMQRVLRENPQIYIVAECYPKGLRRAGGSVESFFNILEDAGFSWCMIDDKKTSCARYVKKSSLKSFLLTKTGTRTFCVGAAKFCRTR